MALQDKYTNADLALSKKAIPAFSCCGEVKAASAIAEIANADDANSVYRLFKAVKSEMTLNKLLLSFDAFGGAGVIRIGLYESKIGGETYNDDVFCSDVDVSAALANQNGLTAVDLADRQQRLWELAGHTLDTKKPTYDICLKITVKGATGLGTVLAQSEFLQG